MDVLLIDPVTTARSLPVATRRKLRKGIGYPGLGLLTVAALTPRDVRVRVIDESVEEIDHSHIPDLVGISVQAPTAPYAYSLASSYRKKGVTVVLGGIHVSLNPGEATEHADAIVVGEAEATWPGLLDDFRNDSLRRVYRADSVVDLEMSPRPRRDLLCADNYRVPHVVQASKGCSFACEFCSLHEYVGHTPRYRSVASVVQEIREMPGGDILFVDDNFYADSEYTSALLRELIPLRKRWISEATWQIAFDEEVLALAKASGCIGLFVGFDSINRQQSMKKVPPDAAPIYIEAMQNIRRAGIPVVAAFVFGLDNDEPPVFARSLEVALEGGANLVNFSALVPYPGTPIHSRLASEGRILTRDWSQYISPNVCYQPLHMSPSELREGVMWAQREFYSVRNITARSVRAMTQFGWGVGLLSIALNVAQKRNWGKGSDIGSRGEVQDE